jgi:hypothetical protein
LNSNVVPSQQFRHSNRRILSALGCKSLSDSGKTLGRGEER